MDQTELVNLVKQGDEAAAFELVSSVGTELEGYCARIAPDLSTLEREAAVDDALRLVVKKIDKYNPELASVSTWARAFVRHAVSDIRRKPRELATPSEDLSTMRIPGLEERFQENDGMVLLSPTEQAVLALVLQETEADSALLYAHAVERLTFQEISTALAAHGVPAPTPAALRKRYQRIRERLLEAAAGDAALAKYLKEATENE